MGTSPVPGAASEMFYGSIRPHSDTVVSSVLHELPPVLLSRETKHQEQLKVGDCAKQIMQ